MVHSALVINIQLQVLGVYRPHSSESSSVAMCYSRRLNSILHLDTCSTI
jgi:hypothetical protein